MSQYTTELRFICEQLSGLDESVGYNGVEKVIEKARPKIFDFDYPIFDPSYKQALEEKIILHYYTREICEETIGLWKLRLKSKMREIMPYYNQLYESTLIKFDPFTDIDYTLEHKGRANESKKLKSKTNVNSGTDYTENTDTTTNTDIAENIISDNVGNEKEVTNTTGNENTKFSEDKITNETTNTKTHTDDTKDTTQNTVEDKLHNKNVKLNDVENTAITEKDVLHGVTQKDGDNTTTLKKEGQNVDTTDIDETTVKTPDLSTKEKTDNFTHDHGTGFDARNINRSEDTITRQNETSKEDGNGTKNYEDTSLDLYADTPQGNLLDVDNGTGEAVTDGMTIRQRLDSRYLTNARDIDSVHNETTSQHIEKSDDLSNTKNFDETTDDNITYTRNYNVDLDGTKTTTETGKETTDKTGHDVVTHDIDETHTTHELIDETTTTDTTDTKNTDKAFTKDENETTAETEHNTENVTKNEVEGIDTTTDFTRSQTENTNNEKDVNSVEDFNGNTDTTEHYTRDKNTDMDYTGKKDVTSHKELLENIYDNLQHNIRNTDEYVNHAVGKISDVSKSKMLLEFRETFINIDEMIIEELNELFFLLY